MGDYKPDSDLARAADDLVNGGEVSPLTKEYLESRSQDDPCKMDDAQYEEYINGPNRARWTMQTGPPIEHAWKICDDGVIRCRNCDKCPNECIPGEFC